MLEINYYLFEKQLLLFITLKPIITKIKILYTSAPRKF